MCVSVWCVCGGGVANWPAGRATGCCRGQAGQAQLHTQQRSGRERTQHTQHTQQRSGREHTQQRSGRAALSRYMWSCRCKGLQHSTAVLVSNQT